MVKKAKKIEQSGEKISLGGLDFETAVRLTLETGPMPKRKAKPKKRKAKK